MTTTISKGHAALQALSDCLARRQPVPMAVLRQIDACWRHFTEGKDGKAFHTDGAWGTPAPMTLGEAFGVADHRGGKETASRRRRLALLGPKLATAFGGDSPTHARTRDGTRNKPGVAAFARETGLSVSELEDWLAEHPRPKVREK